MLRLEQQTETDCFRTCVSCITGIPREQMPQKEPVAVPDDDELWQSWAARYGIVMDQYDDNPPPGLSVCFMLPEGSDEDDEQPDTHCVVWDQQRGVVWDPEIFDDGLDYEPYFWLEIKKKGR